MTAFDRGLTRAVQAADWPGWIDAFFVWLTAPPFKLLWLGGLVLVVVLAGGGRGSVAALLAVVAVAIADQVAAELVKPWVDRLRPCFALPEVRLLLPRQAHSPSFPSNHAANAFAAAVALFAWRREAGWLGLGLAALVARPCRGPLPDRHRGRSAARKWHRLSSLPVRSCDPVAPGTAVSGTAGSRPPPPPPKT